MANLISTAQKAELQTAINHVHDTFVRAITVFKDSTVVTLAVTDDYAHAYRSQRKTSTNTTPSEFTINARIYYYPKGGETKELNLTSDDNIILQDPNAELRLKIAAADRTTFDDVELVIVDGFSFRIDSSPRPHGILGIQYYTYTLKAVQ